MKSWKALTKKQKIIGIVGIVVIVGTIGAITGVGKSDSNRTESHTNLQTTQEKKEKQKNDDGSYNYTDTNIDREDMATYCQENYFTLKKLTPSNTLLVSITNYNEKMWDLGSYDSDHNKIWLVQWNGKNKQTDKLVSFSCYMTAKDKDNIKVYQVWIDSAVADGILEQYYADGTKIE